MTSGEGVGEVYRRPGFGEVDESAVVGPLRRDLGKGQKGECGEGEKDEGEAQRRTAVLKPPLSAPRSPPFPNLRGEAAVVAGREEGVLVHVVALEARLSRLEDGQPLHRRLYLNHRVENGE